MTTIQEVLSGKVAEPFGRTRLCGKMHEWYHGPVYRYAGALWISYKNQPIEVCKLVRFDYFIEL